MAINVDAALQAGASVLSVIVGWALGRASVRRAKLIAYYGHASAFTLHATAPDQSPAPIFTHAVVIRNVGKKTATNVRVSHITLPPDFNLWPDTPYRVEPAGGGGADIVIPTLVPAEQVTINYLYFPPLTYQGVNRSVKSDEGFARVVTMLPTPQPSRWLVVVARGLALLGVVTLLYALFSGVLWLIRAWPVV